jgi:serpin B
MNGSSSAVSSRGSSRRWATSIAFTLLAATTACGATASQEVRGSAPEVPGDATAGRRTTEALNAFALDLQRELSAEGGNVVVASYPVAVSLAMARAGAYDGTHDQLDQVLHLDPSVDVDDGVAALRRDLDSLSGERESARRRGDVSLALSADLWTQEDTTYPAAFLDVLSANYGAGVRVVDFRSDPEAARSSINEWVERRTDGRITELVSRGTLKQYTRFVLTSAANLRAPWAVRFDEALTRPAAFHRLDGSVVGTPMMYLREERELSFAEGQGWQAVELPFVGDELSMLVIAPEAGTFLEFEGTLDAAGLTQITTSLRPTPVDLALPQFQFTSGLNLNQPLMDLGLTSAFGIEQADFSGVTTDEVLAISDVLTQTYIGVDEEGVEGEAATVIPRTPPERFSATNVRLDRPFLFFVRHRETGLILQVGRVVDPTS